MDSDYQSRFGAIARLYGKNALPKLHAAHVCIIGVGGVGSWSVEALARSGVGELTLVDLDDVCITNINRQLPALDGNIGRSKVTVLAERVALINPACKVHAKQEFFTQTSADKILDGEPYDVIIDAIDNVSQKALLIAQCIKRKIPLVTVGGAGGKRDATQVRLADLGKAWGDELLRLVRRKLRREHGFPHGEHHLFGVQSVYSAEHPRYPWADGTCATEPEPGSPLKMDCESGFGSATHVTASFGLVAAQEAINQIAAT